MDNGLVRNGFTIGETIHLSLNPCCSGQWSRTAVFGWLQVGRHVLILVVVDNGLVLVSNVRFTMSQFVLILVVVDNGLVPLLDDSRHWSRSLNPCCSGQWSRTPTGEVEIVVVYAVLILVVVDNGLVLDLIRHY